MRIYRTDEVSPEHWEISRRHVLRYLGTGAATTPFAGALVAALRDMPAEASAYERKAAGRRTFANSTFESPFARHPVYKFTFVNHATTSPYFVPTRYGAEDACALVGTSYTWEGTPGGTGGVEQMLVAFDDAVAAKVNGIAATVVDPTAFIAPTDNALAAGIPVVAYNGNAPTATASENHQMAYIGQDLFRSGVEAGRKILDVVGKGDLVAAFCADPAASNLQPRIDGAASVLRPAGVVCPEIATGETLVQEAAAVNAWYLGHKDVKFMYAVDAGSTSGAAATVLRYKLRGKVFVGGFDLLTTTVAAVANGSQLWTIDQQPYLQGFLPVLQLYLYNVSGGLLRPVDTDTGLKFVSKSDIAPYTTANRYEGTSGSPVTLTPPSVITV